jgi:hypothetical protein
MTEALLPSAVSANTSGAILLEGATWLGADGGLETAVPCCPTARGEAIAPMAATAAATRNNEQKIRRQRDGVKVGFGFVIIELPYLFSLVGRESTRNDAFSQGAMECQFLFQGMAVSHGWRVLLKYCSRVSLTAALECEHLGLAEVGDLRYN